MPCVGAVELGAGEDLQEIRVNVSQSEFILSDDGSAEVLGWNHEQQRSILLLLNLVMNFLAVVEVLSVLHFSRRVHEYLFESDVEEARCLWKGKLELRLGSRTVALLIKPIFLRVF